ncbi:VOC family protein [Vagococcus fluvialis]|uniref:Uncharacterized protein n=1 Tax=Vagococcus fluvialis TaxID=2738 RepID=A0A369ALQ9_9ENTE|nr:VOC family protein [Vagococcus fluvialis]MBO0478016.1 VOC family protein [Vagococcus fluvialis]MBO0483275.1 VOC family protein [Vagococcus fluvialis]MBO0488492.1 VOC family protein [Vagococcus fluvialis]MCM2139773.1 VOC family protein [Vagococcus fluvialis]MDT2748077.1 VOC family protein [Vagococcus fluvialis]
MGSFSLDQNTNLASVALKVKDLDKMIEFYRHVLGFHLINEENDMAIMGIGSERKKLLGLIREPEGKEGSNNLTGLYHVAFVLPTREEFALFIKHLMLTNYPIEGKSDHGYAECVYINDPEGNRINFGWDKPKEKWPVQDGKISGVTKELNIQSFLSKVTGDFTEISEGTKVGHVHLSVSDLEESYLFYKDVLGFTLKNDDVVSTKFLSNNDYHHQIALNEWTPTASQNVVNSNDLGVDHVTFEVDSLDSLLELKEHLEKKDIDFYFNKGKKIIGLNDPNGIQLWFMVFK